MARVGQLDGQLGGVLVAHLTDHDHVGVVAEDGAQGALQRQLVGQLDLADAGDDVLHRVLDREHVHLRGDHVGQRRDERSGLARARGAGQDHHAVRAADGLVELLQGALQQAQLGEVRDHLPVVQDSDDDGLGADLRVGVGDRQDAHTVPDERAVDLALDEAVLRHVALEAVHVEGGVLEHRQQRLRMAARLGVPVRQAAVHAEVDLGLAVGVRPDVDVGGAHPDALHQDGLGQVEQRRLRDLGLQRVLVDEALLAALERHAEVEVRRVRLGESLQKLVLPREGLRDDAVDDVAGRVAQFEALQLQPVDDLLQLRPHRVLRDEDELQDAGGLVLGVGVRDGLEFDQLVAEHFLERLDNGLGELRLGLAVLDRREPEGVRRRGLLEDVVPVDALLADQAPPERVAAAGVLARHFCCRDLLGGDEPAPEQRLHDTVLDVGVRLGLGDGRRRDRAGRALRRADRAGDRAAGARLRPPLASPPRGGGHDGGGSVRRRKWWHGSVGQSLG